ncbi:hypothetical protein PsorP6_013899 [Peronosclerospora sorghi]|uniref:Uncharacterized protein n=1 Tax=Peronosclerospora sorghi TaxID=230839 RepID=A0ACC0VIB5_9STRA|nr:hypothetical protein PsorP6_013899 [Peronosclerospora sorghi]
MDQQVLPIDEQEVAEVIQDSTVNQDNDEQNAQLPDMEVSRGRLISAVWELFTNDPELYKSSQATCKHCQTTVGYHKKSEKAQSNLRSFKKFKENMMNLPADQSPYWFVNQGRCGKIQKVVDMRTPSIGGGKQRNIRELGCPTPSKPLIKKFYEKIAIHYYMTGASFVRIEGPYLLEAVQLIRPMITLPTRKDMATKRYACFAKYSLFLESNPTGEQDHTSAFLAADSIRVINLVNGEVTGVVMDNTSSNKVAWKILREEFPDKFFQGCALDSLHLFFKDVFASTKAKCGREFAK